MACRFPYLIALALGAMVCFENAAFAQSHDPHRLYEQRCTRCHEAHAGPFVANNLILRDGQAVGRQNGKEVNRFLQRGHGHLATDEVAVMADHLIAILKAGALYHNKCRFCHERAMKLARTKLLLNRQKITGRYTGHDIAEYLERHGRLEADEIAVILEMLKRQLSTAGLP